jgi:alcohol dehydrogenase (cytochrome c)
VVAACLSQPRHAIAQAGDTWTTPAGTLQGTRYSSLNQITTSNVGGLVEEFSFPTNTKASHQGGPLVVNNVMYVVTPWPNNLIAMDLTHPGTALWTFKPGTSGTARGVACCDVVNRGASYANGLVVYALLDGHVVAVNASTGTLAWKTAVAVPSQGEVLTGAPIIVNGKVIVGNSGGEMGVRGWVQALDLSTGKQLWKAYNTGPDADVLIGPNFHPYYAKDQGTNLGSSTWPGTMWQQGGGTVWAWLTYDPELNLLFYGTSQPGVWNPDLRKGDNKWSSTIFARNPDTGQAAWAYQLTPHDNWDYDAVNENIVADITLKGTARQVILHFNKNGFAYMLNRTNGQLISANAFAPALTWSTGVNLTTGLEHVVAAMETHTGKTTTGECPSALGGKDWEPASYSPATGLFYIPGINFCQDLYPMKVLYIAGTPFIGNSITLYPAPKLTMGQLTAWNPATSSVAWSDPEPLALYGGTLATAGNVVFYGTLDKKFKAVDAATGALLFSTTLECGVVSNPMTYTGPDGKQRVAVMTGVGYLAGGLAGGTCPAGTIWGGDGAVKPGAAAQDNRPATALGEAVQHIAAVPRQEAAAAVTSGYVHVFKLP